MAPLLRPGFLLTVDMIFTPRLRLPEQVTNTYPFFALLHFLNLAIPADILQKLILFGALLLMGLGGYYLARHVLTVVKRKSSALPYAAGLLSMLNPFVYDRFMAGQYLVLLGYALLPWVSLVLLQFWQRPNWRRAWQLSGLCLAVSVVSIHATGFVVIAVVASSIAFGWHHAQWRRAFASLLVSLGVFLVGACYWLLPALFGKGATAEAIAGFTQADAQAFATLGGGTLGRVMQVLQLQGFWQEGRELFTMPQAIMPIWRLGTLFLWVLVVIGAGVVWRQARRYFWFFGCMALLAIFVASGIGHSWLAAHIPFFAGYREPQKFVALLALCYVAFMTVGAEWLLRRWQDWPTTQVFTKGAIYLLPFILAPTMLWGFAGQLRPRQYPTGWQIINQRLQADPQPQKVLFLPWHHYMSFGFADRLIANPAPAYFDAPIITTSDPEIDNLTFAATKEQQSLTKALCTAAKDPQFGTKLSRYEVKYIMVAKELDYQQYDYLKDHPEFHLVTDTDSMTLYRNQAFKGE